MPADAAAASSSSLTTACLQEQNVHAVSSYVKQEQKEVMCSAFQKIEGSWQKRAHAMCDAPICMVTKLHARFTICYLQFLQSCLSHCWYIRFRWQPVYTLVPHSKGSALHAGCETPQSISCGKIPAGREQNAHFTNLSFWDSFPVERLRVSKASAWPFLEIFAILLPHL